ncbi:hypothetical protein LTR94_031604, partial [Friedmanniomyces endolithicus]
CSGRSAAPGASNGEGAGTRLGREPERGDDRGRARRDRRGADRCGRGGGRGAAARDPRRAGRRDDRAARHAGTGISAADGDRGRRLSGSRGAVRGRLLPVVADAQSPPARPCPGDRGRSRAVGDRAVAGRRLAGARG